jgi:membrane-associated phospholipid phosphatase
MGVHYLSDVTAGWIYGTLLAFGSDFIFKRWISAKQHS